MIVDLYFGEDPRKVGTSQGGLAANGSFGRPKESATET